MSTIFKDKTLTDQQRWINSKFGISIINLLNVFLVFQIWKINHLIEVELCTFLCTFW